MQTIIRILVLAATLSCAPSYADDEPFNYSHYWAGLSASERSQFVSGFIDGLDYFGTLAWAVQLNQRNNHSISRKAFSEADERLSNKRRSWGKYLQGNQLQETMSFLYRDPANEFIDLSDMIELAKDKLDGKNIEQDLADTRERRSKQLEFDNQLKLQQQK